VLQSSEETNTVIMSSLMTYYRIFQMTWSHSSIRLRHQSQDNNIKVLKASIILLVSRQIVATVTIVIKPRFHHRNSNNNILWKKSLNSVTLFVSVPNQNLELQRHMSWELHIRCVEMRDDCSYCLYWWNCWQSLFELSFRNCQ